MKRINFDQLYFILCTTSSHTPFNSNDDFHTVFKTLVIVMKPRTFLGLTFPHEHSDILIRLGQKNNLLFQKSLQV